MIHPSTELRYAGPEVGYGVFATDFLPKGTILYVLDELEIALSPQAYANTQEPLRSHVEKYSYIDQAGNRIVSWDLGKYVNHCCQANSMSTGYGFEIAIRDIHPGEEITDEYGMFNLEQSMPLTCSRQGCRGEVCAADLDRYAPAWDAEIQAALQHLWSVPQALWPLLTAEVLEELVRLRNDPQSYRSVSLLKYAGEATSQDNAAPEASAH